MVAPDPRVEPAVAEYVKLRAALLAEFPELADDEQALADTLEGEASAPDLVAAFIRDARHDEALADALHTMQSDMGKRKLRLALRAERRREAALKLLNLLGLRKLEQPDFTASIRAVPPRVEILDEAALPDSLCKITRSPDKAAIKTALATGPITGAQMSNGGEALTVRTT